MVEMVVSNASPLIALQQIEHLDLLEALFGTISIPVAVAQEIAPTVTELPGWVEQRQIGQGIGPQILRASLGPGESEAITLSLELNARLVILDDRPARRLAQLLNIPVIGTLGILLAAKRRALLPAIKPCINALLQYDFYIAPHLREQVLIDAGEAV